MKLKSVIIYGLILILCIAAIAGYIMSKRQTTETDRDVTASAVSGTGAGSTASVPAVSEAGTDSAVSASAGSVPDKDSSKQQHLDEVMKKAAAEPDPNPVVGIGRGEDYAMVTEEAVKNAGGLDDIIKEGDTVIIKPNICTFAEAGSGIITDYRTVQKIVDMAAGLGASKIIIAEGSIAGDAFYKTFLVANKYGTIKGADLFDLNSCIKEDCYELLPEKSLTGKALFIPKIYMDADVVINVAKLKTHLDPEAAVSLSLKNSFGVPPGKIYGKTSKNALHALGLKEAIIDINRIRKPDFSVIEGIVGGEGYGPLINDPVKSDIIFAGKDPVALDTVALNFMGFTLDEIPHVKLAGEEKLGISELNQIKIVGADLDAIKMKFRRAVR